MDFEEKLMKLNAPELVVQLFPGPRKRLGGEGAQGWTVEHGRQ